MIALKLTQYVILAFLIFFTLLAFKDDCPFAGMLFIVGCVLVITDDTPKKL